jgi:hypothetical protein
VFPDYERDVHVTEYVPIRYSPINLDSDKQAQPKIVDDSGFGDGLDDDVFFEDSDLLRANVDSDDVHSLPRDLRDVIRNHRYLVLNHSIMGRSAAAQALYQLRLAHKSLDNLLRSTVEGCVLMALIKLQSLEEQPIDQLVTMAKEYRHATLSSAETICRSVLEYQVPTNVVPFDGKGHSTRHVLTDMAWLYSQALHLDLGDKDPMQQKASLQLSTELSSFSITLMRLVDDSFDVSDRIRFNKNALLQLKQRGGTLKLSLPLLKKTSSNALATNTSPRARSGTSFNDLLPAVGEDSPSKNPRSSAAPVVWVPDSEAPRCLLCGTSFGFFTRRHHCRKCGTVACGACCKLRLYGDGSEHRVCRKCVAEKTPSSQKWDE